MYFLLGTAGMVQSTMQSFGNFFGVINVSTYIPKTAETQCLDIKVGWVTRTNPIETPQQSTGITNYTQSTVSDIPRLPLAFNVKHFKRDLPMRKELNIIGLPLNSTKRVNSRLNLRHDLLQQMHLPCLVSKTIIQNL